MTKSRAYTDAIAWQERQREIGKRSKEPRNHSGHRLFAMVILNEQIKSSEPVKKNMLGQGPVG